MAKGKYVDGFVFTVPKKNIPAYRKMIKEAAGVWKKFGALDYYECVGDDLKPKSMGPGPKPLTFGQISKQKTGETVWFSFITYKSRTHRDQVNKKVMAHFDKKYKDAKDMNMPFEINRMAYGGFKVEIAK